MPKQTESYVNVFDLEASYAGGGSFFSKGRYKFESVYYCEFDFNGKAKPGEEAPALCIELQGLDADGDAVGESKPQFWPIRGEGVELANPIKGQKGSYASLKLTGKFDTLMKGGEFYVFMENLRKAEFDMDSNDNDITVLNGLDCNMDTIPDPYDSGKAKETDTTKDGGKKKKDYGPRQIPVVVEITDAKPAGKKKAGKADAEEKPAAGKGKDKKSKDLDANGLLLKYIEDEMDGAKEKEETTRPLMRMELGKWITGTMDLDAEKAREVQALVNDDDELAAALKSFGWKLKGKAITPPAE